LVNIVLWAVTFSKEDLAIFHEYRLENGWNVKRFW